MKIRQGFVSNSSSSSFCIYGASFDRSELKDILNKDGVYKSVEEKGLEYHSGPYDGTVYIGRSWCEMKDEETAKSFKEDVRSKIKELVGEEIDCCTHEEAWYDG